MKISKFLMLSVAVAMMPVMSSGTLYAKPTKPAKKSVADEGQKLKILFARDDEAN